MKIISAISGIFKKINKSRKRTNSLFFDNASITNIYEDGKYKLCTYFESDWLYSDTFEYLVIAKDDKVHGKVIVYEFGLLKDYELVDIEDARRYCRILNNLFK